MAEAQVVLPRLVFLRASSMRYESSAGIFFISHSPWFISRVSPESGC